MTRHTYLDTEYHPDRRTIGGLLELAITDGSGNTYFAVNAAMDQDAARAHPWLRDNVWPHLPTRAGELDLAHPDVKTPEQIRDDLTAWFTATPGDEPAELYAYYGARDEVNLQMLFDSDWNNNHRQIPMHVNDLRTLRTLAGMPDMPPRPADHHHPVADAQWAKLAHEHISRRLPTKYLSRETCLHPDCSRDYDPSGTITGYWMSYANVGRVCDNHQPYGRHLSDHYPTQRGGRGNHTITCSCGHSTSAAAWSGEAAAAWAVHLAGA
ncbi:hypothetical protein [Streptomyces sp. NRRL S-350]|uniref:hypothetical protein n=1 Tax=Streptomyces sp. NRRL S-350 TaxID=1463902 RepID=UPI00068E02DA|nr:hypothetical protein [Streptomyces sp. NRRL S-350]